MGYRIAKPRALLRPVDIPSGPRLVGVGEGFPYIVDTALQSPHRESFAFLAAYWRCRKPSPKTMTTRCEHLLDWLRFRGEGLIDPTRVEGLLYKYRADLEERVSAKNKDYLAQATIAARLDTAIQYQFWLAHKDPKPAPFSHQPRGLASQRRHTTRKVVPFTLSEMTSFLQYLAPKSATESWRNWLICYAGFATGARLDEVLSIEASQIAKWDRTTSSQVLTLRRSKGRRTGATGRDIHIPARLKEKLQQYYFDERKIIIAQAKAANCSYAEPPELFINGSKAIATSIGAAHKQRRVAEMFSAAQLACGQVRTITQFDPLTARSRESRKAKHTFHHTRHTYVVHAYRYYISAGLSRDQAWMAIKEALGHRRVSTTIELYGAAIADEEIAQRNAQFDLMNEMMRLSGGPHEQ